MHIIDNFKIFMITWTIIILLNQIFIFGACFAPYCLLAALPHTGIITAVFVYVWTKANENTDEDADVIQSGGAYLYKPDQTSLSDTLKEDRKAIAEIFDVKVEDDKGPK